jgi:hypothetical protein
VQRAERVEAHPVGHAGRTGDPVLVGEVGERDLRSGGEPVPPREHQAQRIPEEEPAAQTADRRQRHPRVAVRDEQVELARGDQAVPVGRLDVHQRRADPRPLVLQRGQCPGQQRPGRGGERADRDAPRLGGRGRAHGLLGGPQLAEHPLPVLQQDPARPGQPRAGSSPFDQGSADLALQFRELLRERRRREPHSRRRRGDRSGMSHLDEHAHPARVQRHQHS